jgi:hypothetical protein
VSKTKICVSDHEWLSANELAYCLALIEGKYDDDDYEMCFTGDVAVANDSFDCYIKTFADYVSDCAALIIIPFNGILTMEQYHELHLAIKLGIDVYYVTGNTIEELDIHEYEEKLIYEGNRCTYEYLRPSEMDW